MDIHEAPPHLTPTESNSADARDLFIVVMSLERRQFENGELDAAYHTLAAALHLADSTADVDGMLQGAMRASDQLDWIDANVPEYWHSTASTRARGNREKSIWYALVQMARRRASLLPSETRLQHLIDANAG